MVITIQGKPGEGKTNLAKKICEGKKVYHVEESSLKHPFWTQVMDEDIDFILVDDVKNYNETYAVFRSEKLTIEKRGKYPVDIIMPDVVLVLRHLTEPETYVTCGKSIEAINLSPDCLAKLIEENK